MPAFMGHGSPEGAGSSSVRRPQPMTVAEPVAPAALTLATEPVVPAALTPAAPELTHDE